MSDQVEALVPSVSIRALLERRNAMVERLRSAHDSIREINEIGESAYGESFQYRSIDLDDSSRTLPRFSAKTSLPRYIQKIDASAWDFLLRASGLRSFMDSKARSEWDEKIYKCEVPELTWETIESTFRSLYDGRQEMFEQGVINIFRSLSWSYKTNSPMRLGKKIIMTSAIWTFRGEFAGGIEYRAANQLDDLIRSFCVLDGVPEPDHRQGVSYMLHAAGWPKPNDHVGLHGYIEVKGFRNGNIHVKFLRQDLVDRLNSIIAGHCGSVLPEAR